jgi:hypothetical protein
MTSALDTSSQMGGSVSSALQDMVQGSSDACMQASYGPSQAEPAASLVGDQAPVQRHDVQGLIFQANPGDFGRPLGVPTVPGGLQHEPMRLHAATGPGLPVPASAALGSLFPFAPGSRSPMINSASYPHLPAIRTAGLPGDASSTSSASSSPQNRPNALYKVRPFTLHAGEQPCELHACCMLAGSGWELPQTQSGALQDPSSSPGCHWPVPTSHVQPLTTALCMHAHVCLPASRGAVCNCQHNMWHA